MTLTHSRAVLVMVLATFMWSIAGVVTRQLEQAHSFEITFWRSLFTLVSLLVILPLWQGPGVFRAMPWRSTSFWLSGLCWSVMFTAFMVALTLTTVANVLVTMAIGPLLTALVSRMVIGHRLPLRTWLAIVVAGIGIGYMYGERVDLEGELTGSLVALCVPVAAAVQWTIAQRAQTLGQKLDLVPSVMIGALMSSVVTLPLAFPFVASGTDVAWLAMLGLVQLAVPCVLAVTSARVLKAPEVALLGLLEVVFGILLAWLGANEVPRASLLLGGSLVMGALLTNELLGWRQGYG